MAMWNGNLQRIFAASFFAICACVLAGQPAGAAESTARVDQSQPNPQPPYPDSAQLNGEEGTVLVGVLVRPTGRASNFRVEQSSGFEDLDTAAVQGAMNWHYVPAERNGDRVSDWTTIKIVFHLPRPPVPQSN